MVNFDQYIQPRTYVSLPVAKTVTFDFEQDGLFTTASRLWLSVVVVPWTTCANS